MFPISSLKRCYCLDTAVVLLVSEYLVASSQEQAARVAQNYIAPLGPSFFFRAIIKKLNEKCS